MATTPIQQFPYPASTDSADVPRDIKALADLLDTKGHVPVGSMFMWPAANAPVENDVGGNPLWLLMLGQVLLAATYPKLATVLGQAGGNITIPDMRTVFPVGSGAGYPLLQGGGVATVALTEAQLAAHAHSTSGNTGGEAAPDHIHAFTTNPIGEHSHNAYGAGDNGQFVTTKHGSVWTGFNPYVGAGATILHYIQPTDPAGGHAHTGATAGSDRSLAHTHSVNLTTDVHGGNQAHENRPPFRAVNFIIRAG